MNRLRDKKVTPFSAHDLGKKSGMNTTIPANPRIAMLNAAVALLPQFTMRPLADLPKDERKSILEQAVATARDLMRLCSYGDSGLTIADFRTAIATATQTDSAQTKPEWIRLPPVKGRCRFTGLGRSMLYTLVAPCAENGYKAPIRSLSLRRRGTVRGVRLIHLQSLLDYLESHNPGDPTPAGSQKQE